MPTMHLSALAQLGLTGLLVALLPLSMVWVSADANKYRKLVWIAVFLTVDLIMFGGFTRLSDSGLGCPDWPGCYGSANPFLAHEHIVAAETLMPTGPVTVVKAWIEMTHRYLAMAIGVLIVAMMVQAWRQWKKNKRAEFAPALPTALFLFVCLQGAFGAWTVTLKLQPVIVTIHLLLGMGLREFSMHPAQLLAVKQEILNSDLALIAPQMRKIMRSMEPNVIAEAVHQLQLM